MTKFKSLFFVFFSFFFVFAFFGAQIKFALGMFLSPEMMNELLAGASFPINQDEEPVNDKVPTSRMANLMGIFADKKYPDDALDILILGNNGAHSDSIIVANVKESTKEILLFSLPRDLYFKGSRINGYYHYEGVDEMKALVESVLGRNIDYYVKIDLKGFTEIVNLLGGLDVNVEKELYDNAYPDGRGGYMVFSVEKGLVHMDGAMALKYARSRHSSSDFDRAARQQELLEAMSVAFIKKSKASYLRDLSTFVSLAFDYTESDLNAMNFLSLFFDYKNFEVKSAYVFSTGNYLYSQINENGAYMLLPKSGSFAQMRDEVSKLVSSE